MIWVSDVNGHVTYLCREWQDFTGQPTEDGLGEGWSRTVHPDDLPLVSGIFSQAVAEQREFWLVYRQHQRGGGFAWVASGAIPSTSPTTHEFLGFLGSVTQVEIKNPIDAHGELGPFRPPPSHPATAPKSHLDMLADLAIVSRSIAEEGEYGDLIVMFDDVIAAVSLQLARESEAGAVLM